MQQIIVCGIVIMVVSALYSEARTAHVTVDDGRVGQKWEGWGATDMYAFDGLEVEPEAGEPGKIPASGRDAILKLYYQDLGMNRVRFWPMGYEPENDDADPKHLNAARFIWKGRGTRPVTSVDPFCEDHLVMGKRWRTPGEPFTFYPAAHQWESWMTVKPDSPRWHFGDDARFNPAKVDEYAEHALAAVLHIKEVYHYELPAWSLFNEPTNTAKPAPETSLALTLACGRRFKENGLKTRIVICDDVTPEASAKTIELILDNEEARGYVGAVSYHRYCGDFILERVKPMLAKAAQGERLVSVPVSFHASATKYGKSVWVSEQCSYGDDGITYFDTGRARANHICDEINYGKVNAFDFMLCYFTERGKPGNEEAPIFLRFKGRDYASVELNAFGAWISHFTRYIRPGMDQLGVTVDDNLVKAIAFRDSAAGKFVLVVVNNNADPVDLTIQMGKTTTPKGKLQRIRTAPGAWRTPLEDARVNQGRVADTLPGTSVTTYTGPLR